MLLLSALNCQEFSKSSPHFSLQNTAYIATSFPTSCIFMPPTHSWEVTQQDYHCSSVSFLHVEICFSFVVGFHPDVPSYPFDEKFDNFAFNCLLTREEAIVAMAKVRSECNKVAGMSVFQVPVSKSMKLEEFEQTQAQVSTQVSTQLNISKLNIHVTRM